MNIVKKAKLIKAFMELAKITQKEYNENKECVQNALWFFEKYLKEAQPYIEKIRNILKND